MGRLDNPVRASHGWLAGKPANAYPRGDGHEGIMGHMTVWSEPLLQGRALPDGARVGIMGGSFDPPHEGHVHVSKQALKRFGLDLLVWLVSPGNPLKPKPPAPMSARLEAARVLIDHPRILLSDYEARVGTRFTAATLQGLVARHPAARFVWVMGADNLAQFHHWENWRGIMENVPLGIVARPGERLDARTAPAAKIYHAARVPGRASHRLATTRAPAWCFINAPMVPQSSSAIRASGTWGA